MKQVKHYLSYFEHTVKNQWNDAALTDLDSNTHYTYGQLAEQIAHLHLTFQNLGIKPGDKIALCGRNCSNWALTFMAIETYKAVAVSILPDFTGEGIHALVNHSDAKLLYVGPVVKSKIDPTQMPSLLGVVFMDDLSIYHYANEDIKNKYEETSQLFASTYPDGFTAAHVNYPTDNINELALINYTSGTTNAPKGVMLSHMNISGNVDFGVHRIPHKEGDKVLSMLPVAHMFGLMYEFIYQVCVGTHVHFLTKAPTPTTLMRAFSEVHPYMILTVPLVIEKIIRKSVLPVINKPLMKILWHTPLINNVIKKKVREKLMTAFGGELRHLIIGGAALNEEVEACLMQMKFVYTVGYGMTECAPLITYEDWYRYAFRSCGKCIDNMEMRIDSPNPATHEGELLVKGINVMMGYYKNEEATQAAFTKDGWMRTGDLGIIDNEGNLFLKGRNKNLILGPSGQNIYPEELEDKVNSMPLVIESVVVDREGKLVALIYPDTTPASKQILHGETLEVFMEKNRQRVNKSLPAYSQISSIELVTKEFEKTPKRSIKRFMYK